MSRHTLCCIIISMCFAAALFGQQEGDSIAIGSERLKLGMPRDQVLTRLAKPFDLSGPEGGTSPCPEYGCVLWLKGGPPYTMVASLSFKDGRLSWLIKYWSPEDQRRSEPFAQAVFAAISSLVSDGKIQCTINVRQDGSPRLEQKHAYIICGDRKLDIRIVHSEEGDFGALDEWLAK